MQSQEHALLNALLGGGPSLDEGDRPKDRPTFDEQVADLKKFYEAYQKAGSGNPLFAPGDIVTPKKGTPMRGRGRPYMVLMTKPAPGLSYMSVSSPSDYASSSWGARLDMRVITLGRNEQVYAPYWVESWLYELWVPEKAKEVEKADIEEVKKAQAEFDAMMNASGQPHQPVIVDSGQPHDDVGQDAGGDGDA